MWNLKTCGFPGDVNMFFFVGNKTPSFQGILEDLVRNLEIGSSRGKPPRLDIQGATETPK